MKNVLVLGAGLVSRPLVRYLLDLPDYEVIVATRTVSKAEKLIEKHPRGKAHQLDVTTNMPALEQMVPQSDIVISLLPYTYHVDVAKLCIKYKKHMITTSYVSKPMQQLDKEAKEAGIIILNEIGLDPGIDHMSAMRIIHRIQDNGGTVTGFRSYCCGLPAPEANTNPFGYKFSWSPRGVLLAMKNEGRYMENGKEIVIPPEELFQKFTTITIEGAGEFEAYPNRDSLDYIDKYGIHTTKTMYRGTLRNIGWCPTWKKMIELGLLDLKERDDVAGLTWAGLLKKLVGCSPDADVKIETAKFLKLKEESDIIKRMQWLGLFSEDPLPLQKGSLLDILCALLVKKLAYEEGERDMIILHHEFEAEYPDKKQKITSTLIDFGIPAGDTSMARTVSLPAAIATKLIMEGKIEFKGVHIPTSPAVYNPVLDELEQYNIKFREKTETL